MRNQLAMLRHVEERSKSALVALLRVRRDGAERASVEVRRAESVVEGAQASLAAARAELDAHLDERLAFQNEDLGVAVRPEALAQRGTYLSVMDTRIASARGLVTAREQETRAVEKICEDKRRALVEAKAQERAIEARLDAIGRDEARSLEKSNEDDALEAHLARRS